VARPRVFDLNAAKLAMQAHVTIDLSTIVGL
jgi:hypothetical protein